MGFPANSRLAPGLLCAVLVSCGDKEAPVASSGNLRLVGQHLLEVPEPSGVCLATDRESLWMVSDDDGHIYQTDLRGRVLRRFPTGLRDLEGIAMIDAGTLAVLAERDREIVLFTAEGELLRRGRVEVSGNDNKGPEGLCYDPMAGEFFVIDETGGALIRLDAEFRELSRSRLDFARDYSGLLVDAERDLLWVLSDLSGTIHLLGKNLDMLTSYSTNIRQLEGIAVDHEKRRMYLVSDPMRTLYVMDFDLD